MAVRQADAITVFEQLERSGKGEGAGGLPYLNSCLQAVLNPMGVRRYAEMVIFGVDANPG